MSSPYAPSTEINFHAQQEVTSTEAPTNGHRESELPRAYQYLIAAQAHTDQLLADLHAKLSPTLRPDSPKETKGQDVRVMQTELAQAIERCAQHQDRINTTLGDLIDRLEI